MAKLNLSKTTGYELQDLLNEETALEVLDPVTGAVLATIENMDDEFPFVVRKVRFTYNSFGSDSYLEDSQAGESLALEQVRGILALSAKAQRQKKQITLERVGDGDDTYDYTIVASATGAVQVGCTKYTAAEVKQAAQLVRANSTSKR